MEKNSEMDESCTNFGLLAHADWVRHQVQLLFSSQFHVES